MSALFDLERFGRTVAIVLEDGALSYAQLASLSDMACKAVRPTDLVALECHNGLDTLAAYIGCIRKGAPVLLVDASLAGDLRQALYEQFSVSLIFEASTASWIRRHREPPTLHPDLAVLLSTSGSTGSPKLVRLSRRNLTANASSIADSLMIGAADRAITSLPISYSYGLSVINSHLSRGASIALTSLALTERKFWEFLDRSAATSLSGVPVMYAWLKRLRLETMSLPYLRKMTQAGGRLPSDLVTWTAQIARDKNIQFFVMYGQTEATARMACLPPPLALSHPTSIGRPIPGGAFRLVDPAGQEITTPLTEGHLVYFGDNVMMGYAQSAADLEKGDACNGRLETGDIAAFDQDGLFYIRGRSARFIKVYGNRIGLDDVEALLRARRLEVVATGRDDKLVLVGTNETTLQLSARVLKDQLRIHQSALDTLLVPEVPLSSAGKVRYGELLATYDALSASPVVAGGAT